MPVAALEELPMLGKLSGRCRAAQALLSAALLWAFFQPWSEGLGGPASAAGLRERLEGPRQIASWVTRGERIARDHRLAGNLWMLAAAEGTALAAALWPRLTGWPGMLAGSLATGTSLYADHRIARYPMQRLGSGVGATFWLGLALAAVSALRLFAERRRL